MNNKIFMGLLVIFAVIIGLSSVNAGFFDMASGTNNDLNVSNLQVDYEGYSMYDVTCDLTPKKDFNYLEMFVIFYDDNGAVLDKSVMAWNINNPAKDQLIKVSGNAYLTNQNVKPVRAEVFITEDVTDRTPETAIFGENVTLS